MCACPPVPTSFAIQLGLSASARSCRAMAPQRGRAFCPRGYVTQILEEGKSRIVRLLLGDCLVGSDFAVADENVAVCVLCNIVFVGHEDNRVSLLVQVF